jgi:hypothetical protein
MSSIYVSRNELVMYKQHLEAITRMCLPVKHQQANGRTNEVQTEPKKKTKQ